MSKLIIISAPSGAGKTTLVEKIMENKNFNLEFSISATSRAPREYEKNGVNYYFLDKDEFKSRIEANAFVEWEEVYKDQFYGTLKTELERIWANNKNVIFDVDVKGGLNIKKHYPENSLSIFIKPPSIDELKRRLENRGSENQASLTKRIQKAEYEMTFAEQFDRIVVNDDLETATQEILLLVKEFIFK